MFRRRQLTGTSNWIQWSGWNSVCCVFLKSVSSPIHSSVEPPWARGGSKNFARFFPGNTLVFFYDGSIFFFRRTSSSLKNMCDGGFVAMSVIHVAVSVANNFLHSSTAADQGYHAFGELARFGNCLLQKIKKASSLPLVEQWEEYVVPNHSRFPATDEKDFLSGTRVMAALEKVGSQYLRTEFRRDARRFLGESVKCVLSTVASRSLIGQGMSCFCPAIVVGGDNVVLFQLFNKLLVGLLEKGWTRAGWVPVLCAGTAVAGGVLQEEPPWP